MPAVVGVMKEDSMLIALIKPQFEAGRAQVRCPPLQAGTVGMPVFLMNFASPCATLLEESYGLPVLGRRADASMCVLAFSPRLSIHPAPFSLRGVFEVRLEAKHCVFGFAR
jgi:hypothetical protein